MRSAVRFAASGLALAAGFWLGCGTAPDSAVVSRPGASVPSGRLPQTVRPIRYALEVAIDPRRTDFSGRATIEIELVRATRRIWIHGRGLDVSRVQLRPAFDAILTGEWRLADAAGVAAIDLPRAVGPGTASLVIDYRASFDERLRGLYRVKSEGSWYAVTQFEPTDARRAFPGFDEPAFKTPFDVTLTVAQEHVAIANTPQLRASDAPDGTRRIQFATTPPLPTYLIAWAVGPFELKSGPPLRVGDGPAADVPFRGATVRGRSGELRYALDHTPALMEALQFYFGSPYPYRKLDIISVPDFGSGAMENPGAITFRDSLLLFDGHSAPEWQRRAFTYVMAHELAHQWFGNLVTMEWWDDLWLNEAFATWMGRRAVQEVAPEQESDLALLENVHEAMSADSQISARSVRQPIESHHDIHNAFDGITYSKGAGILAMFEHWLGAETFRVGVRDYLERHRLGTATEADLLAALRRASGRDVAAPFRSFLTQPGVPFLEVEQQCVDGRSELAVRQSRYLPIGSEGSRATQWQIPVCARYGSGDGWRETCRLVDAERRRIPLEGGCAEWVMPNASAAGYYRWALAPDDGRRLLTNGWSLLSAPERLSVAMNLEASFRAGAIGPNEVFPALAALAADSNRHVAEAPMQLLHLARERLVEPGERERVERFARQLYSTRYRELGWDVAPGETGETKLLRRAVIHFLAFTGIHRDVRREALRRGRIRVGLDPKPAGHAPLDAELVDTVLAIAVQDGGGEVFDALIARLAEEHDAVNRQRILRALGASREPALAKRARELSLDSTLRVNEAFSPLWPQVSAVETRRETWDWIERHFDALVERVGTGQGRSLPWMASGFCDAEAARRVESFLASRVERLDGGPRNMAGSLEFIRLCAALKEHHGAATRAFFAR
jgi:alanyl aminopeptidase